MATIPTQLPQLSHSTEASSFNDFLSDLNGLAFTRNDRLEQARNLFSRLREQFSELNSEEIERLKVFLPKLLTFSSLRKEQAELAVDLGNWIQSKSPIEAMHYYAIALNIEPNEKKHLLASSIFFKWLIKEQIYKKRLEYAYNIGNPDLFNNIISDMAGTKRFFPDEEHFKLLLSQANSVLVENPKENKLEMFSHCAENLRITLGVHSTDPITKTYREALEKYRESFDEKIEDVKEFQNRALERFKKLFALFLQDAFELLGPPPCEYDLRAMGSWARKEPCPYSDLEWFILIKNNEHQSYFKALAKFIELQIISLGETAPNGIPIFSALGSIHHSGLHIDPGINPCQENTICLIAQPEKMAEVFSESNANNNYFDQLQVMLLRSISFGSSSYELFAKYSDMVQSNQKKSKARLAIEDLRSSYETAWSVPPEQLQEFNLKSQFIVPLNLLLGMIGIYFDIQTGSPLEITEELQQLRIFSGNTAELIKETLEITYKIRVRLHLLYKEQKDSALLNYLSEKEKEALRRAYWLVIRPLYSSIEKILDGKTVDLPFEAFEASLSNPKAVPLISLFVKYLVETHAPLHEHEIRYRKILEQQPLRHAYFKTLESCKVDTSKLAQIASKG